ncbi:MAG TPA: hypothetical protein VNF71_01875 [Acidimicrobiales bacterium]|nr:hypothetical protein [Acidimicrobiales bacterium]
MATPGLEIVVRSAIRALREEARTRAASVESESEDHAFYGGVMAATDDHLHLENLPVHGDSWLSRQPAAFADGYTKTAILIASAGSDPPHRFRLPARD